MTDEQRRDIRDALRRTREDDRVAEAAERLIHRIKGEKI